MEIPADLKKLYKHWDKHSKFSPISTHKSSVLDHIVLSEMLNFTSLRMEAFENKQKGISPLTDDPILAKYKFCNIYRELDRQTIAIHRSLKHLEVEPDLWLLNLAFQRFTCNPETVAKIGFLDFDDDNNRKVMDRLLQLPNPKYGSAYLFPISVIQRSKYPTREEFFCLHLPQKITQISRLIQDSFNSVSVIDALDLILPIFGYNIRFHWTEVLIDVAYQYPEKIDLYKEFPIGPGSLPTMRRLSLLDPVETAQLLSNIELDSFNPLEFNGKPIMLSAENWEGIGCEFRKYSNLKDGKGRIRLYRY